MPVLPNTFIIGSPKAGTTALSEYLAGHPQVCFCRPKELFFWDTDFPDSKSIHRVHNLDAYLRYFRGVSERTKVIAEGTTTYAQSRVAVANILQFNPNAKFIFAIRNPIDVAYAMHGELLRHHYEDEPDFQLAWSLQASRSKGKRIPRNCPLPHQLIYRDVVDYAAQLRRLQEIIPPSQLLIILFDDLVADTRNVYISLLEFLRIPDDGRMDFPVLHASKAFRSRTLSSLINCPPRCLAAVVAHARTRYLMLDERSRARIRRLFTKRRPRNPLATEFAAKLAAELRDDVDELSRLLERDLSSWVTNIATVRHA